MDMKNFMLQFSECRYYFWTIIKNVSFIIISELKKIHKEKLRMKSSFYIFQCEW